MAKKRKIQDIFIYYKEISLTVLAITCDAVQVENRGDSLGHTPEDAASI